MFGFRMAYDWYLKSKLEARKKSTRFRQKRTTLAHSFADYIYPEFAAHENLLQEFELARTIRSLRRGLISTVNRGVYINQLENYLAGSHEDHVAKREVIASLVSLYRGTEITVIVVIIKQLFQNRRIQRIIQQFFILTNGTDNPALQSAYDEYQQLYEMVQKSKYKADMTLKAILDSVDSLTSFILEDLGKY